MNLDLKHYLRSAVGKTQEEIPADNPYREFGFDAGKKRLGWMKVTPFSQVRNTLVGLEGILCGKDTFVFVGIGGSGNGIKALLSLFKGTRLYTLDSLDPAALRALTAKIKDPKKTLVVPISKSGTTQETQLLAQSVRELFGQSWQKNFLWLADTAAHEKLNTLGWQDVAKVPIQFDGESDIGGRFSCPHTLIFFLPLFILLGRDYVKLEHMYNAYCGFLDSFCDHAAALVNQYKDIRDAFFSPYLDTAFGDSFSAWIVQLFQESLGSKRSGLAVKTICIKDKVPEGFRLVKPQSTIEDPVVRLMAHMYFFQVFVALYAGARALNFVNQDFVEKYKQAMLQLAGKKEAVVTSKTLTRVIGAVKKKIHARQSCIEIVLFFYSSATIIRQVKQQFNRAFPGRHILVFIGSDWNHHSYQAAFGDKNTYFVLLRRASYAARVKPFKNTTLEVNIKALKTISQATYVTLKDKSLLYVLSGA